MRYVVTAEEMRAIDRATIDDIGIPGAVLMETAGRAVANAVLDIAGDRDRDRAVVVVCGAGNNGGDGYVVARVLQAHGRAAEVYLGAPRGKIAGDAAVHLAAYENCGGTITDVSTAEGLAAARDRIEAAAVVVDAVFGTGLAREIKGHYRELLLAIAAARRAGARVVAVDIPSGLDADSGAEHGPFVVPDRTVTMAFLKRGLAITPGAGKVGEVEVAEIGIPTFLAARRGVSVAELEAADAAEALPESRAGEHKGSRGHALIIAGSPGKRGAGRLAGVSALRSGAGLATVAGPQTDADDGMPAAVMTADLSVDDPAGAAAAIAPLLEGKRAVAAGPGMATGAAGKALVEALLEAAKVPLVLDADALNHLGTDLSRVASSSSPVILTPHPGEAARLLGCTVPEVEEDRVAAVKELGRSSRAVCVLKGARTLICDGSGDALFVTVNPTGGPALATAGSGDVLCGVIVALAAQGLEPLAAARLGVYVHGVAGDAVLERCGPRSAHAGDIVEALPQAFQRVRA